MEKKSKAAKFRELMNKDMEEGTKEAIAKLSSAQSNVISGTSAKLPVYESAWMDIYGIQHAFENDWFKLLFSVYGDGPKCWTEINSATLASLMPVLNCESINVTWDVSNRKPWGIWGVTKLKPRPW